MIIAILEDGGVSVHTDLADVQRTHEGIDVEDANVAFYDADGRHLKPVFTVPNTRFGFLVALGKYRLEPASERSDELASALEDASYLEPSTVFASLDELRQYVARGHKR
jgi:hypothetical protein